MSVQKCVQNGVTFLDEKFPGWKKRIDPDILEMEDGWDCILGQLAPTVDPVSDDYDIDNYMDMCSYLGLDERTSQSYGFVIITFCDYTYNDLDIAWKEVLVR